MALCLLTAPPAGANLALIGLPGGGVVTAGYMLTANQGSDCRIQRHSSLGGSGWILDDGGVGSDACLAIAAWDKDRVVAAGVTYREGAGGQAYIIGVDAQGRRAFRIAHGRTAHEELRGVAITALGIVGVGLKREANAPARGYLVIADPERGVLGEEVHGGVGEHRFDAVTSLPDGQIVVVGTSAARDALPSAWVVRIARTGDLIWDRRIGGDAWHEARDVVALPDGRIVVVGMAFPGGFVGILAGNGDPISVVRSPLGAPFEAAVTIGDCLAVGGRTGVQLMDWDLTQRRTLPTHAMVQSLAQDGGTLHAAGWAAGGHTSPFLRAWPRRGSWCRNGP